jgi:hypothetical protein
MLRPPAPLTHPRCPSPAGGTTLGLHDDSGLAPLTADSAHASACSTGARLPADSNDMEAQKLVQAVTTAELGHSMRVRCEAETKMHTHR